MLQMFENFPNLETETTIATDNVNVQDFSSRIEKTILPTLFVSYPE